MAFSPKFLCFLFLVSLSSSLQIHARDSQFFNKFTTTTTTIPTTTTPINNVKENGVVIPNKEEPQNKQDQEFQDPNFIPQNGYGLYGHESGQLPPSTTTPTTVPTTNTNNYYHNEEFETEIDPQGFTVPKFTEKGYTTATPTGNNQFNGGDVNYNAQFGNREYTTTPARNNQYNGGGYTYNPNGNNQFYNTQLGKREYTTTPAGNNQYSGGATYNNYDSGSGTQKKGMSDTRFLDNGKYFYDLNLESNYNNGYQNSRGVNYNTKGYYGNNENTYENKKYSMDGYQNQEEYQDDQFIP